MELEIGVRTNSSGRRGTTKFIETDATFLLIIYLSGMEKDEIFIEINDQGTQIRIVRRGGRIFSQKFSLVSSVSLESKLEMGQFEKTFWVPNGVAVEQIKATFDEQRGILYVYMPKLAKDIQEVEEQTIRERDLNTGKELSNEEGTEASDKESPLAKDLQTASRKESSDSEIENETDEPENDEKDQFMRQLELDTMKIKDIGKGKNENKDNDTENDLHLEEKKDSLEMNIDETKNSREEKIQKENREDENKYSDRKEDREVVEENTINGDEKGAEGIKKPETLENLKMPKIPDEKDQKNNRDLARHPREQQNTNENEELSQNEYIIQGLEPEPNADIINKNNSKEEIITPVDKPYQLQENVNQNGPLNSKPRDTLPQPAVSASNSAIETNSDVMQSEKTKQTHENIGELAPTKLLSNLKQEEEHTDQIKKQEKYNLCQQTKSDHEKENEPKTTDPEPCRKFEAGKQPTTKTLDQVTEEEEGDAEMAEKLKADNKTWVKRRLPQLPSFPLTSSATWVGSAFLLSLAVILLHLIKEKKRQ